MQWVETSLENELCKVGVPVTNFKIASLRARLENIQTNQVQVLNLKKETAKTIDLI